MRETEVLYHVKVYFFIFRNEGVLCLQASPLLWFSLVMMYAIESQTLQQA